MSDPTNTDAQTADTVAQTTDTDAQTTSGPAGGDAASAEYPDGSAPPVGDDGVPILEDRSEEFPDVEPGPIRHLGVGSGMSGYRGLAVKRAEKVAEVAPDTDEERQAALALAAEHGYTEADLVDSDGNPLDVAGIHRSLTVEQTPSTPQEDGTGTGGDDDPTGTENEPETGDQGSSDDDAGDDSPDDASADESEPADEGYDPSSHTVSEVQAYLEDNPDQATYVLDRERADKARKTLIGA